MKNLYFVHIPDDGVEWFASEADARAYAQQCIADARSDAALDGWREDMDMMCYGKVLGCAQKTDVITVTGIVDEDGIDEAGEHWIDHVDFPEKCNYELKDVPE